MDIATDDRAHLADGLSTFTRQGCPLLNLGGIVGRSTLIRSWFD